MVISILAAVAVFAILVVVHEAGHFVVAKRLGVRVLRFSIGYPPRIAGFRRGETDYAIGATTLGGYVRILGIADASASGAMPPPGKPGTDASRSFAGRPLWEPFWLPTAALDRGFDWALLAGFAAYSGAGGTVSALPFQLPHGDIAALGFRFGAMAYTPDLVDVPEAAVKALTGIELWIVDALWYRPHPSHFHLDLTLRWIDRIRPKRAILTNMHSDLDYAKLRAKLPPNVEPGYDGMRIEFDGLRSHIL